MPYRLTFLLPIIALALAGCGGRRADWPSLAPRAGEVSTMVPRNVAGAGRCPSPADCAPPAPTSVPAAALPDLPPPVPPPTPAVAAAELAAIAAGLDQVQAAAAPARTARDAARQAARSSAEDSAAAARAEAAQSALSAALAPLAGLSFRLATLDLALRAAPDGGALAGDVAALASRIALLEDQ